MGNILTQFAAIWKKLGVNQKVTMLLMTVGVVVGIVALVVISRRPSYELLYSDVDEKDMARLVEFFKESKVPYQVTGGGRTIMVAEGMKYDVQAALIASDAAPQSGHVGLETYQPGALASTPQQEQMMKRRALQGELSRVLTHMADVEWADVQIALGEDRGFLGDEIKAKAAVTLRLRRGRSLSQAQVEGIRQLVANSVRGLEPKNVSLVDDQGTLLSPRRDDTVGAQAGTRYSYQRAVEQELAGKAQALLDSALGPGKSEVRVTALLDMDAKETRTETFDADKAFATIEKTTEDTTSGSGKEGSSSRTTSEIQKVAPKTETHVRTTPGMIKQLHVAVAIDPTYTDDEGNSKTYTKAEIEQLGIADIVKAAVGYDEARQDTFQLVALPFRKLVAKETPPAGAEEWATRDYALQMARHASPLLAVAVFVLFAFLALRKITKQQRSMNMEDVFLGPTQGVSTGGGDGNDSGGGISEQVSSAAQAGLRNRVREIIDKDPVAAARLLQSWLEEGQ